MKRTVFWIVFVALMVLHHDWWYWNDATLLCGFMPIGLAYHALISLAAATLWATAVFVVWPELFAEHADHPVQEEGDTTP